MARYYPGALVRMRATYVSTDLSTPADPSSVYFRLIYPDNTVATYKFGVASVTRAATGAYYADVTASVYGPHTYEGLGTGGVQAVSEWHFEVIHTPFL
jgi:hypothetical protein